MNLYFLISTNKLFSLILRKGLIVRGYFAQTNLLPPFPLPISTEYYFPYCVVDASEQLLEYKAALFKELGNDFWCKVFPKISFPEMLSATCNTMYKLQSEFYITLLVFV